MPTSPALPSRGVPLRGSPAGRGRCSNLPFHAKLLHRPFSMWQPPRPLAKATDAAAACGVWQPVSIRSHIPFSRDRLPHGDGLARPARIATAGSPAHACHKGTAAATRFESPLRDYPAPPMRQHPERLPRGDSVRQPMPISNPSPFFRNRLPHATATKQNRDRIETADGCHTAMMWHHKTAAHVAAQATPRLPHAGVWQAGLVAAHLGGKGGGASAPGGRGAGPKTGGRGRGGLWREALFLKIHTIYFQNCCANSIQKTVRG